MRVIRVGFKGDLRLPYKRGMRSSFNNVCYYFKENDSMSFILNQLDKINPINILMLEFREMLKLGKPCIFKYDGYSLEYYLTKFAPNRESISHPVFDLRITEKQSNRTPDCILKIFRNHKKAVYDLKKFDRLLISSRDSFTDEEKKILCGYFKVSTIIEGRDHSYYYMPSILDRDDSTTDITSDITSEF